MKRMILSLALAAFLLPSTAAFASGSSGTGAPPSTSAPEPAFDVTTSLKCTVIEVAGENQIRVRDDESGSEHLILLSDKIRLRAQDKKQFDGRKKLTPADFREGHRVLVTARTEDNAIIRIKVLKDKNKSKAKARA